MNSSCVHKWNEHEKHVNFLYGDGCGDGEVLYDVELYRICVNCKKMQAYINWRFWFLLNPWVDYDYDNTKL